MNTNRTGLLWVLGVLLLVVVSAMGQGSPCELWVSVIQGNDQTGDGTASNPFKSINPGMAYLQKKNWAPLDKNTTTLNVCIDGGVYFGDDNSKLNFTLSLPDLMAHKLHLRFRHEALNGSTSDVKLSDGLDLSSVTLVNKVYVSIEQMEIDSSVTLVRGMGSGCIGLSFDGVVIGTGESPVHLNGNTTVATLAIQNSKFNTINGGIVLEGFPSISISSTSFSSVSSFSLSSPSVTLYNTELSNSAMVTVTSKKVILNGTTWTNNGGQGDSTFTLIPTKNAQSISFSILNSNFTHNKQGVNKGAAITVYSINPSDKLYIASSFFGCNGNANSEGFYPLPVVALPLDNSTDQYGSFMAVNNSVDPSCPFQCERGFFADDGVVDCAPCPAGSATNSTNATACVECQPGFSTNNQTNATHCTHCASGYYQNLPGQPYCDECSGDVEDNGEHCKQPEGNDKAMYISIAVAAVVATVIATGVIGVLIYMRKCRKDDDYDVINS